MRRATTRLRTLALALMASTVMTAAATAETITIWSGFPEMVPFYERVAASLQEEMPDLEVNVEAIALREHEKRIALALTSGAGGPKVIELAGSTAQRYIENDLLPPLPDELATFVSENFGPFFIQSASADGTLYGVPIFRGQGALFYNIDMFEDAGLTEPPATMAEYTDYANKLTQRDGDGKPTVSGWSLRLSGGGQGIAEKFWINLHQFGGSLLEQTEDGKWRAGYANEAGRNALKQYLDAVHTDNVVSVEMPADAEAFQRGQTAMFIRESWVIGDTAAKAPDLNYATAPLPEGSIALAVNLYSSDADSDATWAFMREANKPEHLIWMLENVGWLPNLSGVDYSEVTDKIPQFGAFVNYPEGYEFFTLPAIGPIEEILTRAAAQLTNAFGDADLAGDDAAIDAYLAAAAEETNRILEREGLLAQ
ncbi:MAG: extracellular solute-binding protein [Pseudomonadota bacterium]